MSELELTAQDKAWLEEMDRAMQPKPMVSIEAYCAAVEYGDFVTRRNQTLLRQRKRLLARARRLTVAQANWRRVATGLGVIALVLVISALARC